MKQPRNRKCEVRQCPRPESVCGACLLMQGFLKERRVEESEAAEKKRGQETGPPALEHAKQDTSLTRTN